jgi:hypothetical protein
VNEKQTERDVATMCPNCKGARVCKESDIISVCSCETVFNPLTRDIIESPQLKQVRCNRCHRAFQVDTQSSVVVCSCGTALYVNQTVQLLPVEELSRTPQKEVAAGASVDTSSTHLGKLESVFPGRADELRDHLRKGGKLSGPIKDVADRVWSLSQLWMVFLDGDDFMLTRDRGIYDQIVSLANTHPRCSIEDEAEITMRMFAKQMSNFEIATALGCVVDAVGTILVLNGNYDYTYQMLVSVRVDPTLRK